MAGLGLSYAAASGWVGAVKSSLCRWLRRTPLQLPQLAGRVLEMDGMWTRTRAGSVEMKVVRDENGVALGSFAGWSEVIDLVWQPGATAPVHPVSSTAQALVSDGVWAIAAGIAMVYGSKAPHQLCHFHLLREYRRNLGWGLAGSSATAGVGELGTGGHLGAANYGADRGSGPVLV